MLLHQLPYNLKTIFRKYENKCKNKINKIWSLKFNQTCFNENLWPTYSTNVYIIKLFSSFVIISPISLNFYL